MSGMSVFLRGCHHNCTKPFAAARKCGKPANPTLIAAKQRRNFKLCCATPGEVVNFYEILGVQPTASERDIKVAFRRRALESHPDISKEAGADVKFIQVRKAYDVLSCKARRQAYDRELQRWWAMQRGRLRASSNAMHPGAGAVHQTWSRSTSSPPRTPTQPPNTRQPATPSEPAAASTSGRSPHTSGRTHSQHHHTSHSHFNYSSTSADPRHRGADTRRMYSSNSSFRSNYTHNGQSVREPVHRTYTASAASTPSSTSSTGSTSSTTSHGYASFTSRPRQNGATSSSTTYSSTTYNPRVDSNQYTSSRSSGDSFSSTDGVFDGRFNADFDMRYNAANRGPASGSTDGSTHGSTNSRGERDGHKSESGGKGAEEDGWNTAIGDASFKWVEQVLGWGSFFQQQQQEQQQAGAKTERERLDPGWGNATVRESDPVNGAGRHFQDMGSSTHTFSQSTSTTTGWATGDRSHTTEWISTRAELKARLSIWDAIIDNEMELWKKNIGTTTTILKAALSDFDTKMEEKMEQSDKEMSELQQTLLEHMGNLDEQLKGHEGNGASGGAGLPKSSKWYSLMQQWSQKLSEWIRVHCSSMERWYADMGERAAAQDKALEQYTGEMYRTAQRLQQLMEDWDESFDTDDAEVAELWESRRERWSERIEEVMGSWFLQVGEYERAYQRRLERCQLYTQSWVRQASSAKAQWQSRMRMWNMKAVAV